MKNTTCLWLLLFTLLTCYSCHFKSKEEIADEQRNEEWKKYSAQVVNHWIGRKMILPELPIVTEKATSLDYKNTFKSRLKMVSYVDGTCGVCISNLSHWKKFIEEVKQKNPNCDFMFYIYADDENDFQKDVISKLKLNNPWIFDNKMKFVKENNLNDLRFQTALLNSKNEVLMIGTIAQRPELEALYKDMIENKLR